MATYQEIKNEQPVLFECFFAFSNQQYAEGIAKHNLQGKKLFSGFGGLIGTQEGIAKLYADYDAMSKRVTDECDPQEVYDYEFGNHECGYTCNDSEAMKIVISHFPVEKYDLVKRKYKYYSNEELLVQIKKDYEKK